MPGLRKFLDHPLFKLAGVILTLAALAVLLAKGPADSWQWLESKVPPLRDAAEERTVTSLIAGADLSDFEQKLGNYTFKHGDGPFVEYVFVTRHCFVQAITKKDDTRVFLWSVTLRKSGLEPTFLWPAPSDSANDNPISPVTLGKTRFFEWGRDAEGEPYGEIELDGVVMTSSGDFYVESMSLSHADDFATVLVAISPSGVNGLGEAQWEAIHSEYGDLTDEWPTPLDNAIATDDLSGPDISLWRKNNVVNTYAEAAPEFSLDELFEEDGQPRYSIFIGPPRERMSAFVLREERTGQ